MNMLPFYTGCICLLAIGSNCNTNADKSQVAAAATSDTGKVGSYGYDKAFLQQHIPNLIELKDEEGKSKLLISPEWQGRVMTSTAMADSGVSFGWLNYELLTAHEKKKQFNAVGGEERFWLGPEGGQYSIYFKKGDSFNIAHWQVPAIIDTLAYKVESSNQATVTFTASAKLNNYSGTAFDLAIRRTITLLPKTKLGKEIGITLPDAVHVVSYETTNEITNTGAADWTKKDGLLSIWLLGMFTPAPQTVVIIPFVPLPNSRSMISDNYFGSIPPERLRVQDSVLYFTCDGKYRSKIGLSPAIAKSIAASYDFANNVLTLVLPEVHKNAGYVNSKWEIQKEPYKGDVINAYNDGPLADGGQLGPFYEIESSSPALELKKGGTGSYRQVTCHLQGDYAMMKKLVQQLLAVDLDQLKK